MLLTLKGNTMIRFGVQGQITMTPLLGRVACAALLSGLLQAPLVWAQGAAGPGVAARASGTAAAIRSEGSAAAADSAAQGGLMEGGSAPSCVGGLPRPIPVRMNVGKSTLVDLPEAIVRRTVGDPRVIESRMVSEQTLYLASGRIGSTNVILQGKSGRCMLLDVVVSIDTDAVQAKLSELLPREKDLRVVAAGDSLVLTGVVSDAMAVEQAVAITNAYLRTGMLAGLTGQGPQAVPGAPGTPGVGVGVGVGNATMQTAVAGGAPLLARVINMLSVASPQQVMLEVKIAEVAKTLLDQLGVNLAGFATKGNVSYAFVSNLVASALAGGLTISDSKGNSASLQAQKTDGLVRILAEPNIMAISGQEGSFLAGGKVLIPVAQGSTSGLPAVSLEEKEFGVGLKFSPTVLGDGRINLRVAPEVSELAKSGVSLSTGTFSSTTLPLITTRRASTTVQLFDGQSFAIGGLIRSSGAATVNALPLLGELPVLGALFRSTQFQEDKSELVFIVTPRLIKPLQPEFPLPTDQVGLPDRRQLMIDGRLDSGPVVGRSPAPIPMQAPAPSAVVPGPAAPVRPMGFEIR
jgi:pilus assembly protein CpaC